MKRDDSDEKVHFLATGKGLFTLLSGVVALWLLPLVLLFWEAPKGAGEAGDMFGGVTALFSGLAFAGLIAALFTQRQELITQRKELGLQRKELELSRREYKLQRFENTLFAMIELFNGHVQSFVRGDLQGRKALHLKLFSESSQWRLCDQYVLGSGRMNRRKSHMEASVSENEQVAQYVEQYIDVMEPELGPYFRLLYNTFRHIDNAELAVNDDGQLDLYENNALQQKYAKIVRAYFSIHF